MDDLDNLIERLSELAASEKIDDLELPGTGERDIEDAFAEHDIEYWVWDGNRLIPAPPSKLALIRKSEALRRLDRWKASEEHKAQGTQRKRGPLAFLAQLTRRLRKNTPVSASADTGHHVVIGHKQAARGAHEHREQ